MTKKGIFAGGTDTPKYFIYPFFLVHMFAFGASGFIMAYSGSDIPVKFLYAHGGFAILVYSIFYLAIFGLDEVKWMFINSALGLFGIYSQIDWLLSFFGKTVDDYPIYVHVIPFLYFVLYTFLIRQAVLDITRARNKDARKKWVEFIYVAAFATTYAISYFSER